MIDFINVVDLAKGNKKALEILNKEQHGIFYYDLGTGNTYSALEKV